MDFSGFSTQGVVVLGTRGWGMVSSCLAGLAAGRWPLVAAGLEQIKSGGQFYPPPAFRCAGVVALLIHLCNTLHKRATL
jgi:hypothetical protein